MPKGRELVGLPVVSREKGEEVGRVQDLLYDQQTGRLKAVVLEGGSWLRDTRVVPFNELEIRGGKTFYITSAEVISHELPAGSRRWQEIRGMPLINNDGIELGLVEDVVFELPSGQITALELSTGLVNDLMEGRQEISLNGEVNWGTDTVIIG
ncbi:MAG: hypothetical protein GX039_02200 [Clostridia bacterium]|nr:hypothetical protein [Clostridia bacterium]